MSIYPNHDYNTKITDDLGGAAEGRVDFVDSQIRTLARAATTHARATTRANARERTRR